MCPIVYTRITAENTRDDAVSDTTEAETCTAAGEKKYTPQIAAGCITLLS